MQIIINNHSFRYEMENISRMFLSTKQIEIKENLNNPEGDYVLTEICDNKIVIKISLNSQISEKSEDIKSLDEKDIEWQMAGLLYDVLAEISGKTQKWGLLTGVRPTRLVHRMLDSGKSILEIKNKFINEYRVSDEKFRLLWQTSSIERNIIKDSSFKDFSLYISIPFCPSRCNYCSFVSSATEKMGHIIPEYVSFLAKEIEDAGKIAKDAGLRLKSVYFGGGTPTTLSAEQLKFLMGKIEQCFDLSYVNEYTVEAGRPDTVTKEKLQAIFQMGADRISINPQTFNDDVLKAIGRKHTTEQTISAYNLAREFDFKTINMDLIAGLSSDTFESFKNSLETAVSLKPENITLHTLTVKRAADLRDKKSEIFVKTEAPAEKMVSASGEIMYSGGYIPYYMYRQKGTLSNLENVGYCLSGHEGHYNIYIMDEVHSIIALGAGAVTKLVSENTEDVFRIYNYKYPAEYISGFENIINRKKEVLKFYEK